MSISTVEAMIDQYIVAWNSDEPEQYATAFAKCWAPDGTYSDPNFPFVEGLSGITELAESSLKSMGHRTFSVVEPVKAHDNTCLYKWRATFPDGRTPEGYDYVEYNESFLITRLVSFY